MIIEMILLGIFNVIKFIFGLLPSLPPMPQPIVDMSSFLIDMVSNFSQLAVYIYGSVLFVAIVTLSVALMLFDQIYNLIKFIAAKLPINIK